jgi:hypothetical protein
MKRNLSIALFFLAAAGFAAAQPGTPTSDVLGAHLNYGRGCAACHAPHSGAFGNGAAGSADTGSGNIALWGEDLSSLKGVTLSTGQSEHGMFSEPLPQIADFATRPDVAGVLMCLSCHDGNYATGAMMQNVVYEKLPSTYGTKNNIPTLLANEGGTTGNYLNDHPVGINAVVECNSASYIYGWDCIVDSKGAIQMTGPNSSKFVKNYGWFVSTKAYNSEPTVMCTTCHNQHLMNVVNVTSKNSGLTPGPYKTMFFIRAPYNPASTTAGSNQTAQFCRQCHGAEGNEMLGVDIPTIF